MSLEIAPFPFFSVGLRILRLTSGLREVFCVAKNLGEWGVSLANDEWTL